LAASFDTFLQRAWADHADHPETVALRLRTQTPAPETGQQLGALAQIVVHVCAEHLGEYADARWRLAALAGHALADAAVQATLRVGTAALTLAEGGQAARPDFTAEETIRSDASAAAICLGRKETGRAMAFLRAARERLAALPGAGASIHRPVAIACNNLTWELHGRGDARSAEDTEAMLDAAAASKFHWSHAGGWLEVERADYGLALCHASAGNAEQAVEFAQRCLAACSQHDAPPYEHFFAHEALARALNARGDAAGRAHHVAAAEAEFAKLAAKDQEECRKVLANLKALAP
jgi:hypothetical protein